MKRISAYMVVIAGAFAPTLADAQSVLDANPACMERNGPDCVIKSDTVPQRSGGPIVIVPPVVTPPVTLAPPGNVSPSATLPPRGTVPPTGIVGSPEPVPPPAPTKPVTSVPPGSVIQNNSSAPGDSNVITPSGQGSTIISPRK